MAGLIKGFGKGIGGVVLKPGAGRFYFLNQRFHRADWQAFWGIPGYTFKGIYKELQKHLGSSVQNYIIAARTAQGYDEWMSSTREERLGVVSRWHATQLELNKGMHQVRHANFNTPHEMLRSRQTSYEQRKKTAEGKKMQKDKVGANHTHKNRSRDSIPSTAFVQAQPSVVQDRDHDSIAFEEAIQNSVAATSMGNPEEDRMIEMAIRASVVELQLASGEGDSNDAVHRAIQASIAEASRARRESGITASGQMEGANDHDRHLEAALRQSMLEPQQFNGTQIEDPHLGSDDPGVATDDDENVQTAIEMSKVATAERHMPESDEDLQKALEASRKAQKVHEMGLAKSKTEEDIVLEYIKKQSEAEEKLRKFKPSGKASSFEPDEVELQRAIKESLKLHTTKS